MLWVVAFMVPVFLAQWNMLPWGLTRNTAVGLLCLLVSVISSFDAINKDKDADKIKAYIQEGTYTLMGLMFLLKG